MCKAFNHESKTDDIILARNATVNAQLSNMFRILFPISGSSGAWRVRRRHLGCAQEGGVEWRGRSAVEFALEGDSVLARPFQLLLQHLPLHRSIGLAAASLKGSEHGKRMCDL